jgi:LPS-assembly protein
MNEYLPQMMKQSLFGLLLMLSFGQVGLSAQQASVAKRLWWQPNNRLVCGGAFYEPANIKRIRQPGALDSVRSQVTAKGPTLIRPDGTSVLQDHVLITQPGRMAWADKALIDRDAKAASITRIRLIGHVRMIQHGRLLLADHATIYLNHNRFTATQTLYHLNTPRSYSVWGRAKQARGYQRHSLDFNHATLSTCSPAHPSWIIHGHHVHVDNATQNVIGHQVWLGFAGVPIFYTPYLRFSLNHDRKTGFLLPSLITSSHSGKGMHLPFYWNIAPNKDATLTTTFYSKRGFLFDGLFRYLNYHGRGQIKLHFLPHDALFSRFRQDALAQLIHSSPSRDRLKHAHAWRYALSGTGDWSWGNWQIGTQFSRVGDDYYLQDFSLNGALATNKLLFSRVFVRYALAHWQSQWLVQGFQVLHPLNQSANGDQYMRLPQWDGSYFHPFGQHWDVGMSAQWVNFSMTPLDPATFMAPEGQRYHWRPSLAWAYHWAGGFFQPQLAWDWLGVSDHVVLNGQSKQAMRHVPMFSLDNHWFLQRTFSWRHHSYQQMLEPRLYYLYVPYRDQDNLPNFSTNLALFNYNQLFIDNRFTDVDRIGDANQLSLGVSSQIVNENMQTKWSFGSGIIDYFSPHRVGVSPAELSHSSRFSPLVSQVSFYPSAHWQLTGNSALDLKTHQVANAGALLHYIYDPGRMLDLGYDFVRGSVPSTNYSRFHLGYGWSLGMRWSTVGYVYYDITNRRPENYDWGLTYAGCCYGLRFLASRVYLADSGVINNHLYDQRYMIQLVFKGLGGLGDTDITPLLRSTLPNYRDPLRGY